MQQDEYTGYAPLYKPAEERVAGNGPLSGYGSADDRPRTLDTARLIQRLVPLPHDAA